MYLRFPSPSIKTFPRGIFLLITFLLLGSPIAAQNTKQAQAQKLLVDAQQLIDEGSTASLTKAIEELETARTLSRAAGDRRGEATALFKSGLIHNGLGHTQKALDTLGHAVMLFPATGDREDEATALVTIGALYHSLSKHQEALSYYDKVLKLCRDTGNREGEALILSIISQLYTDTHQTQKAKETLEQALSVARAAGSGYGEIKTLLAFGLLYIFLQDGKKALEYFEQALPLVQAERDRGGESVALRGLCMAHILSGAFQKGVDYCSEAVVLLRELGDRPSQTIPLFFLAIVESMRGNLAASQVAIESAITNVESLRTNAINPELRLSFLTYSQPFYEFYIRLLMHLHKEHPKDSYDGKALEVSERARARSLLETLTEANADIRQGVDAALHERESEIQRRLNSRAQTQMQLPSRPHSERQAIALAEEIKALIDEFQQVETEIRQTSPHYAALTQPRQLTLKEIQAQVLDEDTLLLEYSLGEVDSFLWVVTPSSINSYVLPKESEIDTAARRFYERLNARNVRVKGETNEQQEKRIAQADAESEEAATTLSRIVLGPVVGQLGNKRLMIVADGALHFVSFGALPVVVGKESRFLIADHEIVNLPSASTLAVIREEVAGRQMPPKSVAVLADPVFMKDDERVKKNRDKEPPKVDEDASKDRQLVKAAAEDTGVASEGFYIPRLPGTRQEAEQIVAMLPTTDYRLALDFAASRDTAMSAELGQYRYVHFSTHGFLDSAHPELSGLLFSLVNERGEEQEGFLRAHELFNLKLPAEVVVLSACQTGMGTNIKGEGLVSLTRGFMYAGAPRVVVSLWGVSDVGTTELMVRFYQSMLKDGMRPAAALRAAQLSLMNDKRWASPYYWAPFILQGEWR